MLDSDPEEDPVEPPRCPPRPLSPSPTPPPPVRRLSPPSSEPQRQPVDWGTLLTRMKPDAPKAKKIPKRAQPTLPTPPPPPATTGKRAWLSREDWLAKKRREEAGGDGFDIRLHGYWLTREGLVFQCPDGRRLPAAGVDAFDA
jgi:hypothetical protein